MRTRIVYALVGIAIALGSAAQPQPVDATVRAARQLLDDGRAAEALAMLEGTDVSRAGTRRSGESDRRVHARHRDRAHVRRGAQ